MTIVTFGLGTGQISLVNLHTENTCHIWHPMSAQTMSIKVTLRSAATSWQCSRDFGASIKRQHLNYSTFLGKRTLPREGVRAKNEYEEIYFNIWKKRNMYRIKWSISLCCNIYHYLIIGYGKIVTPVIQDYFTSSPVNKLSGSISYLKHLSQR